MNWHPLQVSSLEMELEGLGWNRVWHEVQRGLRQPEGF